MCHLGCEIVKKRAKGQKISEHMVQGGVSLVRSSKVVEEVSRVLVHSGSMSLV